MVPLIKYYYLWCCEMFIYVLKPSFHRFAFPCCCYGHQSGLDIVCNCCTFKRTVCITLLSQCPLTLLCLASKQQQNHLALGIYKKRTRKKYKYNSFASLYIFYIYQTSISVSEGCLSYIYVKYVWKTVHLG